MALKRQIPEEYMDYDYGFTGVSEEEYRKKETEADQKVSEAEADAAKFNAYIGEIKSLVNSRYNEHKRLFP